MMSGPSVYLTWPNAFHPFPADLPHALPPPIKERTFRSPFGIEKNLFNFALQAWIPITFASIYIFTVFSLNAYNRSRDHKAWWIAKQKPFNWFVVVHNVFLAVYSIATFLAMVRAIVHTWPEGGLLYNPNGAAGVADALCKLHGPRGLGDAATYNTTINIWEAKNTAIHLGYDGNPDPTDVGRLWNEGLAFWGWMFYISKFYEVLDTMIILAKGKRSATLQTYHHAGAMLCMWAGIRYMSPPIWMFVFINSAIHGMMYTYFTFSALGYKVPQSLKRTLTSLQITQFVFGASYAAAHLFVAYDIPISTPYQIASTLQQAASSVSSAASHASSQAVDGASTVSSLIESPAAVATMGTLLKKLLLRAAGEEGLAERVRGHDQQGALIPPKLEEKMERFNEQTFETRWRTDWTKVNCIDTSGEAFAIYLNLLYLAPLTWLFARFFIRAYTQRGKSQKQRSISETAHRTAESAKQGEKDTEDAVEAAGKRAEDELQKHAPSETADKIKKETAEVYEQLKRDVEEMRNGKYKSARRVSDRVASFERQAKTLAEKAKEKAKDVGSGDGGSPRRASPSKRGESAIEEDENGEEDVKTEEGEKDEQPQQEDEREGEGEEDKENQLPLGSGTNNESEEKQEENMADSAAIRDGARGDEPKDSNNSSQREGDGQQTSEGKEDPPALGSGTNNESEEKQEANMADSQATRPGAEDDDDDAAPKQDDDDSTDAMGKSGSIIDLAKERANEATKEAEKQGGAGLLGDKPTEGAEESGTQWKPPGSEESS